MDGTHRAMGNGAAVAPEEVSMASRVRPPRRPENWPEADPSRIEFLRPHRAGLDWDPLHPALVYGSAV